MRQEPGVWSAIGETFATLVPDIICLCRDNQIVAINPAGSAMLRAGTADALVGLPVSTLIHPDYQALSDIGLDTLAEETDGVPLMLVALDGSAREVHLRVTPVPDPADASGTAPPLLLLHGRDLTERTRAVEGLLASENRFRTLVEQAFALICLVRDGVITFMNAEGRRLLKADKPAETLIGTSFGALLHPDYAGLVELGLPALAQDSELLPLRLLRRDGVILDVEARVVVLGSGHPETVMVEARDITERKRVAQALRDREQRLQGILDTVTEAIVTTDETGQIRSFNPAARDMFGYAVHEAIGQNVTILMPAEHADVHDTFYHRIGSAGHTRVMGITRELEGRRKDGSLFPIEIGVTRLDLASGTIVTGIIRDITERRRREEAERRYKEELESQVRERTREVRQLGRQTELILKSAGDGIVGLDVDGRIIFANPVAERLLRAGPDALRGRPLDAVFRSEETGGPPSALSGVVTGCAPHAHGEATFLALDGNPVIAEYAAAPITDEGRRTGAVFVFRDISARKEAEERLRLAYTVFAAASEAIVVCDTAHTIGMVNPAFTDITGYAEDAVMGQPVAPLLFDSPARFESMIASVLGARREWSAEFWHQRSDGTELALRLVASAVVDQSGRIRRYALVISDITRRKRDEERILYQARHDTLTGLANRALFMEVLASTIETTAQPDPAAASAGDPSSAGSDQTRARVGPGLALLFIDLDGFKAVNDTLGHDAGDLLLKGAANRIVRAAREQDTVARLGGDEFTVILPGVLSAETAVAVAGRILEVISAPYSLDGRMARVSGSIGIALAPAHGTDVETILRHADAAMYQAKQRGKGTIVMHSPAQEGSDASSRPGRFA